MTSSQDKVVIFDTTLRDGEQSPGATMTHAEKLEIAGLLDEMGVDIIEAGFPIASEGDFNAVSEIAKNSVNSVICGLARAQLGDIDRCWEAVKHAAQPRIHTFIGTSPLHRAIPNLTKDEMAIRIEETVSHARNLCDNVQWSPMDATRTEFDYLCRTVEIAIKAGATTINIPDTVGYTAPRESAQLIRDLLEHVPGADNIIFATHCHNDLGMATANSLAAVEAGADVIHGTALGVGERAGNAPLDQTLVNLSLMGVINNDLTSLNDYMRKAHEYIEVALPRNYPVFGKDAFETGTGVHASAVVKAMKKGEHWLADRIYSGVPAQDYGLEQVIRIGHMSGRSNITWWLGKNNYEVTDDLVAHLFDIAKKQRRLMDDDEIHMEIKKWKKQ